jgi:hypothetical protein
VVSVIDPVTVVHGRCICDVIPMYLVLLSQLNLELQGQRPDETQSFIAQQIQTNTNKVDAFSSLWQKKR